MIKQTAFLFGINFVHLLIHLDSFLISALIFIADAYIHQRVQVNFSLFIFYFLLFNDHFVMFNGLIDISYQS